MLKDKLPKWFFPDDFNEVGVVDSVYEGISNLDYETYTRIERDLRSSDLLANTMFALVGTLNAPIPELLETDEQVEAWKSMRLAKATQIVDQLIVGLKEK